MSAIEWTDRVWNPVTGCDRVSPGCAHCYALELAPRLRRFAVARGGGKWADAPDGGRGSGPAFGVQLHPAALEQPLRWRRPRRVFVNSMSDLFHDDVPDEFIAEVYAVMAIASQHTFQVLTKRPDRAARLLRSWRFCKLFMSAVAAIARRTAMPNAFVPMDVFYEEGAAGLRHVWLGVSIENRRYVSRADVLRSAPAAVRFVSAEPLLGPLVYDSPLAWRDDPAWSDVQHGYTGPELNLTAIDWLIVGGESGTRARPMRLEWARGLHDAARAAGTAFFMKQLGGRHPGGALAELPLDLQVRDFPDGGPIAIGGRG